MITTMACCCSSTVGLRGLLFTNAVMSSFRSCGLLLRCRNSLTITIRLAMACCREARLEKRENLSVPRPQRSPMFVVWAKTSLRTSGSCTSRGISSSSFGSTLVWLLRKLGPVIQSDPVRSGAERRRVARSAGFWLVSIYLHC